MRWIIFINLILSLDVLKTLEFFNVPQDNHPFVEFNFERDDKWINDERIKNLGEKQ